MQTCVWFRLIPGTLWRRTHIAGWRSILGSYGLYVR